MAGGRIGKGMAVGEGKVRDGQIHEEEGGLAQGGGCANPPASDLFQYKILSNKRQELI